VSEPTTRRQRRKVLTDKMVAALPRRPKAYFEPDPELPSHGVRVQPAGASSFYVIVRDPFRKQRWVKIGSTAELTIAEARESARSVIRRVRAGLDPFEAPAAKPDTFATVAQTWITRRVEARKLRTAREIKRMLEKHVLPHWRDRIFADIKRSDIAKLLDHIEDKHGAWVADATLTVLRTLSTWYAARDDDYLPPFTKGMKRVSAQARKRSRLLTDAELTAVWKTAETNGSFGALVRLLLLTGQRREKVVSMRWDDVSADGVWRIRTADREKGNAGALTLPARALEIIRAQPRFSGNPHVFPASRGNGAISGHSKLKAAFDASSGVTDYTLHDLRRCARSLMSRANVRPDVAERVLGHAIPGIAGVYDVHSYEAEKADALLRLAALIERVVSGEPGGNVVTFPAGQS
jgi:integrase